MRAALAALALLAATPAWAATIGLSLPLSGRYAPIGRQIEIGVLQAIEDHVREGGERPTLAFVDDACTAEGLDEKIEPLKEAALVIGLPCFEPAFALTRMLDVPLLSLGLRHPETASRIADGAKLFVVGPAGDGEAKAIADQVLAGWRDVPFALLDDGSVYGRALSDTLRELAQKRGLRPLEIAGFRPLQSNQAALVRRLARSGVEAVFVAGGAEDAATFARDAARVAPNMQVATGESGALVPFLDETTPPGLRVVATPARRDQPKAFILAERLENLNVPPDDGILEGYALTQIAFDVLAGKPLAGTHETVIGELTFGPDQRAVSAPMRVLRWNGTALVDEAAASRDASPSE